MSYQEPRPEREREVIVTDTGRPGGGPGAVIAAIIGLIAVILIGWFVLNVVGIMGGQSGEEGGQTDVNIQVPEDGGIEDGGGQDGGDTGGGG